MTDSLVGFVIFWGVWLFVPMLVDGVTAAAYFVGALRARGDSHIKGSAEPLQSYPLVSIIIPVYNGAKVIPACVEAVRRQSYPHRQIEVLIVDNQSTDETRQVVLSEQSKPFAGRIQWISLPYRGKPGALNAGIYRVNGDIIANIDADTILHKDALLEMVRAFEQEPKLAAATGAIEVWPADLDPITGEKRLVHPIRYILAEAEFLEYFVGFRIGRQYQSQTNSLFTLAGAFSAFRREILLRTFLYDRRTVSEDTDLTFFIAANFPDRRVRVVGPAIAYVEPTETLRALYAQRVRWQRGQLEVAAMYPKFERHPFRIKGITLPKSLIVDHTLAFPRVVWTFLMPMMYFLGYPLGLVVSATLSMYLIYMVVEALYVAVAYLIAEGDQRRRILRHWWMVLFTPAYRWMTFWFRFGGFLAVMMEPKQWRVRDPLTQTREGLQRVSAATLTFLTGTFIPRIAALFGLTVRPR
jgi:putative glycosyltransferase (exosortase G-associated)